MTTTTRKNDTDTDTDDPNAVAAQTPAAEEGKPAPRSLDDWKQRARQAQATIDTLTAERDALQARLDTAQQGEVESLVSAQLHDPADFWRYGPPSAELLGEDGGVDPAKVADALTAIVTDHPHIAVGFGISPAAPSSAVTANDPIDFDRIGGHGFQDLLRDVVRGSRGTANER